MEGKRVKLFFYVNIKIHIIILRPNLVSLQLFAQGGVRIAKRIMWFNRWKTIKKIISSVNKNPRARNCSVLFGGTLLESTIF